jgi:sulfonate transport system substrate-binding protein
MSRELNIPELNTPPAAQPFATPFAVQAIAAKLGDEKADQVAGAAGDSQHAAGSAPNAANSSPTLAGRLRRFIQRFSVPLGLGLVALSALVGASLLFLPNAKAQTAPTKPAELLRIGFQKSASLFVLQKAQGSLEKKLAPLNVEVRWVEFPAGPQLLEGLNVGSVDVGFVGEAPPIFAQAAGANFVYLGHDPAAPEAEALVVPKDSPIRAVGDLRGKKIALNKGSNVHYLLVKLLEAHGLKYGDVQPVFLPPADARAAFERGSVDAWVIWDPFTAAAQQQIGARILADAKGVANNFAYYLGARSFVERRPDVIAALFEDTQQQAQWLKQNIKQAAAIIAPLQGLSTEIVEASLRRYQFGVRPLSDQVIREQQRIADTFAELKLIPRSIDVRQAAWTPPATVAARLAAAR